MTSRLDVATTLFSTLLAKTDAYHQSQLFANEAALDQMAEQAAIAADAIIAAVDRLESGRPSKKRGDASARSLSRN